MRMRRLWAVPSLFARLAAFVAVLVLGRPQHADAKPCDNPGARAVSGDCVEWGWASIASECTSGLGPKSFGGVQV